MKPTNSGKEKKCRTHCSAGQASIVLAGTITIYGILKKFVNIFNISNPPKSYPLSGLTANLQV